MMELSQITIQQIKYAVAVAECRSFSAAARWLNISQPSLSNAVRQLEDDVGILVFNRSGQGATLTNDGAEFIPRVRRVLEEYENAFSIYTKCGAVKRKFGVSTQHYSFAVKAFVELVRAYGTEKYDFAIRETRTRAVIDDVATLKSEIGLIYLCPFNEAPLTKLLNAAELDFHELTVCQPFAYVHKSNPLAKRRAVTFKDLAPYPCLSFEQGDDASFYFAEEILATADYPRVIKACDRATMLNLMVGLGGYTLCSGIIRSELNGDDYRAVPFQCDRPDDAVMRIGFLVKRGMNLSEFARLYLQKLRDELRTTD